MLILDFTGIYENEEFDFYKETFPRSLFDEKKELGGKDADTCTKCEYVSLKDISGTNCICDDYATAEIRERLDAAFFNCLPRITFFDNGNYHYMSKILMEKLVSDIKEGRAIAGGKGEGYFESFEKDGFDLVVFDNHPDMKWTSYGEILSCGSWVLNALKDIPELRNVYVIGANKKLMDEALDENKEVADRVHYYENFEAFKIDIYEERSLNTNIYISVDKDVLSKDEVYTNWDQGNMTFEELKDAISFLKDNYEEKILAVDICGECTADSEEVYLSLGAKKSNMINRYFISAFLNF